MVAAVLEEASEHWTVRLNRPQQLNAINLAMTAELHLACDEIEKRPKPVLFIGEDGNFAAGADISELVERDAVDAFREVNAAVFRRILRLKSPTVALVDGYAYGGGAELAFACDFRIGTVRSKFASPEVRLGIIAGAGACSRLVDLVGEGLAKEVLLAGRVIEADEALRVGLITRLVAPEDLLSEGQSLVGELLKADRNALAATKAVMGSYRPNTGEAEALAQAFLFGSPEHIERMGRLLKRSTKR